MKFTIDRDALTDAVGWTARSLSPRPPVPVLSGLLIKAENGEVTIASFDYETSAIDNRLERNQNCHRQVEKKEVVRQSLRVHFLEDYSEERCLYESCDTNR